MQKLMKRGIFLFLLTIFSAALLLLTACPTEPPGAGEAAILSFVFAAADNDALDNDITGTIDGTEIAATVPYGTDVTALVPTITIAEGASIVPASGEAQDFTDPVTYTVTGADGETTTGYTVTVSIASAEAGTACDITGFLFAAADNGELSSDVTGTIGTGTVDASVPFGTDRSALVPTITCSDGASVDPASGEAQDFSSAVTYTVTAEDAATTQEYTVTVGEAAFQEVDNEFDSSSFIQHLEHDSPAADDLFGGYLSDPERCVAFAADGKTLVVGSPGYPAGNDAGSAFVFEYQSGSGTWSQVAQLNGSNVGNYDEFGVAVSISRDGTVIAVGAEYDEVTDTNTGLVYVFERPGDAWSDMSSETALLNTSISSDKAEFGCSVAVNSDGSVLAAGDESAYVGDGEAYVFLRPESGWSAFPAGGKEAARLSLSAGNQDSTAYLGSSIAVSGDGTIVAVGAMLHDAGGSDTDYGAVFVFEEPAGGWDEGGLPGTDVTETAMLTAATQTVDANLGKSVAITADGTSIVSGAYNHNVGSNNNAGAVMVYHSGGPWGDATEDQMITAFDDQEYASFGCSVALTAEGGHLLVGSMQHDLTGTDEGAAYLYPWEGSSYNTTSVQKFQESLPDYSYFGLSVALSPDASTLCITAPGTDGTTDNNQGIAFIYQ